MKLDNQVLLELTIELEELRTEREGMIVLNIERQNHGHELAYTEEHFFELQNRMKGLREGLIHLGEK